MVRGRHRWEREAPLRAVDTAGSGAPRGAAGALGAVATAGLARDGRSHGYRCFVDDRDGIFFISPSRGPGSSPNASVRRCPSCGLGHDMCPMPARACSAFAAGLTASSLLELAQNRGTSLLMMLGIFDPRQDHFLRLPHGASSPERLRARVLPGLELLLQILHIVGDGPTLECGATRRPRLLRAPPSSREFAFAALGSCNHLVTILMSDNSDFYS